MEISTVIFIALGVAFLSGIFVWRMLHGRDSDAGQETPALEMLQRQMQDLARMMDQKIGESTRDMHHSMQSQSRQHMEAIRDVTRHLTKLDATNKQVVSFADQLKNLQDILKNPKQRGILGEFYLETTLKNVLPPNSYTTQYRFSDGSIVDAVVRIKDKLVPIDAKFTLENYNRLSEARQPAERDRLEKVFKQDLKTRIDETSKYIKSDQGTMDFAFMFIPHEAIYYDLLVAEIGGNKVNTQDLIEYAFSKNVLIVSPTSFLAFLQTVMQGLRALSIEESAQQIKKHVEALGKHLAVYEDYHDKLGKTLATTVNHYNHSAKELKKIDKDLVRIGVDSIAYEPDLLEKPFSDV